MAKQRMRTTCATSMIAGALGLLALAAHAAEYKYRDDAGTFHLVPDLSQVPARYRDGATRFDDRPAPKPAATAPATDVAAATAGVVPAKAAPPPTVIKSKSFATGHIVVDAKFARNVYQPMMVDTGASITNISFDTAKRLGLTRGRPQSFLVAGTASGTVILPVVRVESITVGDATAEDLPVVVNPFLGESGLLGIDFLGHFTSQVDAGMQTLTLAPLDTTPRPGIYGGHPKDWWVARRQALTIAVTSMRAARAAISKELSSSKYDHVVDGAGKRIVSPKEAAAALDDAVQFWQDELRKQDVAASNANAPHG